MITDVLIDHPWMSPLALVLLLLVGPLLGARLATSTRFAWWLFGASLLPVVLTTMAPTDRRTTDLCTVQWMLPTPARVELMANVVLFVAPALLLTVASRRAGFVLLGGIALSATIELVQALVPAIGRSCDTTDGLSNTIGAAIGAALGRVALGLAARHHRAT